MLSSTNQTEQLAMKQMASLICLIIVGSRHQSYKMTGHTLFKNFIITVMLYLSYSIELRLLRLLIKHFINFLSDSLNHLGRWLLVNHDFTGGGIPAEESLNILKKRRKVFLGRGNLWQKLSKSGHDVKKHLYIFLIILNQIRVIIKPEMYPVWPTYISPTFFNGVFPAEFRCFRDESCLITIKYFVSATFSPLIKRCWRRCFRNQHQQLS